MMALTNRKVTTDQLLMAAVVDRLSYLVWMNTKDAQHNRNRPKSILDTLTKTPETEIQTFASGEEFERYRNELLKRAENGN